jgi:hypothetical protein
MEVNEERIAIPNRIKRKFKAVGFFGRKEKEIRKWETPSSSSICGSKPKPEQRTGSILKFLIYRILYVGVEEINCHSSLPKALIMHYLTFVYMSH